MNVISKIWNAAGDLADAIKGLAGTIRLADAGLKHQLGLTGPGEVIDNEPAPPAPKSNGKKAAGKAAAKERE